MKDFDINIFADFKSFYSQQRKISTNPSEIVTSMKSELPDLLKNNIMLVSFKKVNSDEVRCMRATLQEEYLPTPKNSDSKPYSYEKDTVLRLFDLEADGWRSLRYENLIDYVIEKDEK